MPLSSQMHIPKLMGEDDIYIKYGCAPDEFETDGQETKDTDDGVVVTMAKRKVDGQMGVMQCAFSKSSFDQKRAGDWIAAQKFSLEPADMHSVKGVEIFSTGTWNGKHITNETLDSIVDAFTKTSIRPALKLGHDEDQKLLQNDGLPAAGWVENVRKVGSKLVADFVDIPKKIYQLIQNKAYRKVSCEIYNNIKIDGKEYPKVLGAVALLGADLPGVLNLNDILSMFCAPRPVETIEKFAASTKAVIISSEHHKKDGHIMPELDVEQFKAKIEQSAKDLEAAKTELSAKDAEIEKYKNEAAEANKKILESAKVAKAAQVDAFVAEVQAEKLCTKAMVPFVKALVGEEMESYSVEDKQLSKAELVKSILKFSHEASKVNLGDSTGDDKTKVDDQDLGAKIEKYAADNKVAYKEAYKVVTRGMDLKVKSLGSNDSNSEQA